MIREDFLFQNAFDKDDAYTPLDRQYGILKSIVTIYEEGQKVVNQPDYEFSALTGIASYSEVPRLKEKMEWSKDDYQKFQETVRAEISALIA